MTEDKSFSKFLVLWSSQVISELGVAVTLFSVNLLFINYMYSGTNENGLAIALSVMTTANYLGYLLSQPYAGIVTDQFSRKRILMFSNVMGCLITFLLVLCLFFNIYSLIVFTIYSFLSGITKSFIVSSFTSSIVMIVPEKHLTRANGLTQSAFEGSKIIAPFLTILIVGIPTLINYESGELAGITLALAFNLITYVLAIVILYFVDIPNPLIEKLNDININVHNSFKKQINNFRDGLNFFNPSLLWLLSLTALGNLIIAVLTVIVPIIASSSIASDTDINYNLAILTSSMSIGIILGGVIISLTGDSKIKSLINATLTFLILSSVVLVFLGLSSNLVVTSVFLLILYTFFPIINAFTGTLWQTIVPPEIQGRVFSIRRIIGQSTLPIGSILAGYLVGEFSPRYFLLILGILLLIFSIFNFYNKYLRKIDRNRI